METANQTFKILLIAIVALLLGVGINKWVLSGETIDTSHADAKLEREVDSLRTLVKNYDIVYKEQIRLINEFDSLDKAHRVKLIIRERENAKLRNALVKQLETATANEKREILEKYFKDNP